MKGRLTCFAKAGDRFSYAVSAKRGDLIYTKQIVSASGNHIDLIGELKRIADLCGASLTDVVKLNILIPDTTPERQSAAEKMVTDHWPVGKTPAMMFIPGKIPGGAALACDAVIAVPTGGVEGKRGGSEYSIAPQVKDLIFASGRVGKGGSYRQSIPGAINQLLDDYIKPQGSSRSDVVQIRAYVDDIDKVEEADEEIGKMFNGYSLPPVIYIEWARPGMVEIEMIATAPGRKETDEALTFSSPKDMKPSPVFSRVAILHAPEIIYMSGIVGGNVESPQAEVVSLFEELKKRSEAVGSDLRHLAKATYLVSDKEVDKAVSEVRPDYYDPARPPAASKIFRNSVGPGQNLLVDMIAVPAP
ncbi:MAG: hypothetical protein P1V20_17605 [Verrucomicrobiales bacterium]|nr:hypothetical protein [Verrucomicrobiales bacterium]